MSNLIPEELQAQMIRNAYDVTERGIEDHSPVVKLFANAGSAIWLLSELDPFYPDIAFGLCDLGFGFPELGNVSIAELESVSHPTLHIPLVERDEHFTPTHSMSVYAKAARMCQRITENPDQLAEAKAIIKAVPE